MFGKGIYKDIKLANSYECDYSVVNEVPTWFLTLPTAPLVLQSMESGQPDTLKFDGCLKTFVACECMLLVDLTLQQE